MRFMNQRFALQRFLDVHHRRQRFINHIDRFRRILGQIAAIRQHHRHRIAHITNLAVSQRILQKPQQIAISPQPHRNRPRLHHGGNVVKSNHIRHARHSPRRRGINGKNAGMSVRATHDNRVQHIRQLDIIHKPPPPGKKPPIFLPPQRGANISLRHFRPQFRLLNLLGKPPLAAPSRQHYPIIYATKATPKDAGSDFPPPNPIGHS